MSTHDCRIVDYRPEHAQAFRDLNLDWIESLFAVEARDLEILNDPEAMILDPGGFILIAERGNAVVGSCALTPLPNDSLELSKMAVSPSVRGQGIGRQLGEAALQRAEQLGVRCILLETNRKLSAALALYAKLGFEEIEPEDSEYVRCDVRMRCDIGQTRPQQAAKP